MKNLLTLLFLVISVLAFGQSNSQSLEVEIKYWKSIAESNDTVAYREYLQRYGEDGLYYDEAITRIALLKTSGKQAQSKSIDCYFYSPRYYVAAMYVAYVVRFDAKQSKIWLKPINYDTVRSNLAVSRDFYEKAMSPDLYEKVKKYTIFGKFTDNNNIVLPGATILATHTSGSKYLSIADANGNYYLKLPYRNGTYQIVCRMDGFPTFVTSIRGKSQILNIFLNKESSSLSQVVAEVIQDNGNAWTTDEEYQHDPMKSTSARDVYFKRDNLETTQGYKHVTLQGYRYVAFSKDKSSFIMWFEQDNNLDGIIHEKTYYYRISKEDLLPKAVNYDFLNE